MSEAYSIQVLEGQPIVWATYTDDFSIADDMEPLAEEILQVFDSMGGGFYYIADARVGKVNFSDLVAGLSLATSGKLGFLRHPNLIATYTISSNQLMQMWGKALSQKQYGGLLSKIYSTPEEAMAAVREDMAAQPA